MTARVFPWVMAAAYAAAVIVVILDLLVWRP